MINWKGQVMLARPTMESDPAADLWRRTLSQIPGVYGRLVYLGGLRNPNTGLYEHHGLASRFSEVEADRVLRASHERTFQHWLTLGLRDQKADLDDYLSSLLDDKRNVIETWLRAAPYERVMPDSVRAVEVDLFRSDFQALLNVFKNEFRAVEPDRGA